jgi:hypothetical protein
MNEQRDRPVLSVRIDKQGMGESRFQSRFHSDEGCAALATIFVKRDEPRPSWRCARVRFGHAGSVSVQDDPDRVPMLENAQDRSCQQWPAIIAGQNNQVRVAARGRRGIQEALSRADIFACILRGARENEFEPRGEFRALSSGAA